jgi:hypothetical protein
MVAQAHDEPRVNTEQVFYNPSTKRVPMIVHLGTETLYLFQDLSAGAVLFP